ncbi:MAG TPA: hypothetical protein VF824_11280 [Thermoanaerobaculia bacterium]|jgi:hypothetical protein
MRTTRSRMLLVFVAAAIIVSIFMNWGDAAAGFRDGWNDSAAPVKYR